MSPPRRSRVLSAALCAAACATVCAAVCATVATASGASAESGAVWSWGWTPDSASPLATTGSGSHPRALEDAPTGVTGLGAGRRHAVALTANGSVWTWGDNALGQLGIARSTRSARLPVRIELGGRSSAVAAGEAHCLALREDGSVVSWGAGVYGQLGRRGDSQPAPVVGVEGARAIAAGRTHSLAALDDGSVVAWGNNEHGALGDGSRRRRTTPVRALSVEDAVGVAAGGRHSLALDAFGRVWSWGSNGFGQLGLGDDDERHQPTIVTAATKGGTEPERIRQIAAGENFSLALDEQGSLWSWGQNFAGQLGVGDTIDRDRPTRVVDVENIVAFAAGKAHAAAIDQSGRLWVWGQDARGQLGLGTGTDRPRPRLLERIDAVAAVAAGPSYSVAFGHFVPSAERDSAPPAQRPQPAPEEPRPGPASPPTDGDSTTRHTAAALGKDAALLLGSDGKIRESPASGGLAREVAEITGAVAVAAGHGFALALLADGTVSAWGANEEGQLGNGSRTERERPGAVLHADGSKLTGVVAIAAGSSHALAVTVDGTVFGWGDNQDGQLGGSFDGRVLFATPLEVGSSVRSVAAGPRASVLVTSDGRVHVLGLLGP